jgi:exosome complex component RRP4
MFTITSRPPASALAITAESSSSYATHRRHPDEQDAMDLDGEDDEYGLGEGSGAGGAGAIGGRAIVGPGEGITSAKEYMR